MSSLEPFSTDVINAARIRVMGVGGLGLVAMALLVAIFVPRIGQSVGIGLCLGVLLAVALIAGRRRAGPLPSSGQRVGANTILSIDTSAPPTESAPRADGQILIGAASPLLQ